MTYRFIGKFTCYGLEERFRFPTWIKITTTTSITSNTVITTTVTTTTTATTTNDIYCSRYDLSPYSY